MEQSFETGAGGSLAGVAQDPGGACQTGDAVAAGQNCQRVEGIELSTGKGDLLVLLLKVALNRVL